MKTTFLWTFVCGLIIGGFNGTSLAADKVWYGDVDGDFWLAGNWDNDTLPSGGDTLTFDDTNPTGVSSLDPESVGGGGISFPTITFNSTRDYILSRESNSTWYTEDVIKQNTGNVLLEKYSDNPTIRMQDTGDMVWNITQGTLTNEWTIYDASGGTAGVNKTGAGTLVMDCGGGYDYFTITAGKVLVGANPGAYANSPLGGTSATLELAGGTLGAYGDTRTCSKAIDLTGNSGLGGSDEKLRVTGVISETGGSYGLTLSGSGGVHLNSGSNSFSGDVLVNEGMLTIGTHVNSATGNNSPVGQGEVTLNGGGLGGGASYTVYYNSRTLTVSSSSYLGDDIIITGALSGSGDLTKIGSGTCGLQGDHSSYSGDITVQEGTLYAAQNTTTPLGTGAVTVLDGTTLIVGGGNPTTIANNVFIEGEGVDGVGALTTQNRSGTLNGAVTMTGDTMFASGTASHEVLYLNGVLGGDYTATIFGEFENGSEVRLNNSGNTFTGDLTVARGVLHIGDAGAMGGSLSSKTVTVQAWDDSDDGVDNSTSTLEMNGYDVTVGTMVLDLQNASGDTASVTRSSSGALRANTIVHQSGTFNALSDSSGYDWATSGTKTFVADGGTSYGRHLGLTTGTDVLEVRSGSFAAELGTGSGQTGSTTQAPTLSVTGGTLVVNQDLSSSPGLTVTEGTVRGRGTLPFATVGTNGTIAPGNSIDTLTVDGDLDLDGTLDIEFNSDGDVDILEVAGELDLAGATLSLTSLDGGTAGYDFPYVFATYNTLAGGSFAAIDGGYQSIDYNYLGGNQIAIYIPEPASILLLILGATGVLLRRHRR